MTRRRTLVRSRLAAAVGLPASLPAPRPEPAPQMPLRPHLAPRRDIIEHHQGPEAARAFEQRIAAGERVC
jgi:hypothetical protein